MWGSVIKRWEVRLWVDSPEILWVNLCYREISWEGLCCLLCVLRSENATKPELWPSFSFSSGLVNNRYLAKSLLPQIFQRKSSHLTNFKGKILTGSRVASWLYKYSENLTLCSTSDGSITVTSDIWSRLPPVRRIYSVTQYVKPSSNMSWWICSVLVVTLETVVQTAGDALGWCWNVINRKTSVITTAVHIGVNNFCALSFRNNIIINILDIGGLVYIIKSNWSAVNPSEWKPNHIFQMQELIPWVSDLPNGFFPQSRARWGNGRTLRYFIFHSTCTGL